MDGHRRRCRLYPVTRPLSPAVAVAGYSLFPIPYSLVRRQLVAIVTEMPEK